MKLGRIVLTLILLIALAVNSHAQVKTVKKTAHRSLGAAMAGGKKIYTSICLACHMADGGGVPNMNPPLMQTTYVLGDKKALIKIVLNGFKEDVEINGQKFSNNMTPHSDLKDQEIADVLTYVRHSFGNKASSITASEVRNVRASNL